MKSKTKRKTRKKFHSPPTKKTKQTKKRDEEATPHEGSERNFQDRKPQFHPFFRTGKLRRRARTVEKQKAEKARRIEVRANLA